MTLSFGKRSRELGRGFYRRVFAKVFSQIFDSSLAEDYRVRFVFEDLLKLANIDGVVDMTHEAIARRTNVPVEMVRLGITELEKPDPKSRTADHEGRRILRLDDHRDWGWMIVNYRTYRELASEQQRRAKTLARVRKHRCNASVTQCNADVTHVNDSPSSSASVSSSLKEGESEREFIWPKWATTKFKTKFSEWVEVRKAMGKKPKSWEKMFQEQLTWLSDFTEVVATEVISSSIRNNYQGLFELKNNRRVTPTERARTEVKSVPRPPELTDEEVKQNLKKLSGLTGAVTKKLSHREEVGSEAQETLITGGA